MHSRFDRSRKKERGFFDKWGFGFVVLPVLLAIAMIVLSVIQPINSNWIAESVQAELAGKSPISADAPTQSQKPATQTRTLNAK
jgi:hypothetical protein